uniref:ShKT domain-containing protein n=1 Tax=Ditylenchus dipsaci TaxID=166011 RepID=A0A915DU90_9BILA
MLLMNGGASSPELEPSELLELINRVDPRDRKSLVSPPKNQVLKDAVIKSNNKARLGGGKRCEDNHKKCKQWSANGFCTKSKYSREQRFRLCAKSCKLC